MRVERYATVFLLLGLIGTEGCGSALRENEDGDEEAGAGGTGAGPGMGTGGSGQGGGASTACVECEGPETCPTGFCNAVASDDFAELVLGYTPSLGVCSAPGATGTCGCFTAFIDGDTVCTGTGCSGTPVRLCTHLSGDPHTGGSGIGGTAGAGGQTGGTAGAVPIGGTGSGAGGTAGVGTGGSGGVTGNCVAPADALVADFSGPAIVYSFGDGLAYDTSSQAFHVSGTVTTFGGFGIAFAECVDASAYSGVSFSIRGNAGPSALTFQVGTQSDTPTGPDGLGSCSFTSEDTKYSDCVLPTYAVAVTENATTIRIPWSLFTGGKPVSAVAPDGLLTLQWNFAYSETTFPVDVTVDDVTFY